MDIDRILLTNVLKWQLEFVPEKILEFMAIYEEARQINTVRDPWFVERGITYLSPQGRSISWGLLSIASVLLNDGFSVSYLQHNFFKDDTEFEREFEDNVKNSSVLGISCYTITYSSAAALMKKAKEVNPNITIIIGGPHASYEAMQALTDGADIVVRGYGEDRIHQTIAALEHGDLSEVPGITYCEPDGNVRINPQGPYSSLNELPFPAFHLLPEDIRRNSMFGYETVRGCPFKCRFCIASRTGINERDMERVFEDFARLQEILSHNVLFLGDCTFNFSKKRIERFCEFVKKEDPDIFFKVNVRADMADKSSIDLMSKSHFVEVYVGCESGSNTVLEKMQKGEVYEQYIQFFKSAQGKIPRIGTSWMIGYPGETHQTAHETILKVDSLYKNNLITGSQPKIFIPFPGSPFYQNPAAFDMDIYTRDWDRYIEFSFPVHRLAELSEFEIWGYFVQLLAVGLRNQLSRANLY